MSTSTTAKINAILKREGRTERLVRYAGCYYYVKGVGFNSILQVKTLRPKDFDMAMAHVRSALLKRDLLGLEIIEKPIGTTDSGSYGEDHYILLTNINGDLTPELAEAYVLPAVYIQGNGPGTKHCHSVDAVQYKDSSNSCIVTVKYRWDV